MAAKILLFALLPFFLSLHSTLSASPPDQPPTPSPEHPADPPLLSPSHPSPSPSPQSGSPLLPPSGSPVPSLAPSVSPPAPPPSDLVGPGTSPSPAPTGESDNINKVEAEEKKESSGMSGGKKAGIVVGVLAAVCLVGLGGLVYKKRQENIRRTQYGYAARRELL